jgi:hypothetical protein
VHKNHVASASRIKTLLKTPPEIPAGGPRLKSNLDTDLLKLIAIISMLIDHIGGAFFRSPPRSGGPAGSLSPSFATV